MSLAATLTRFRLLGLAEGIAARCGVPVDELGADENGRAELELAMVEAGWSARNIERVLGSGGARSEAAQGAERGAAESPVLSPVAPNPLRGDGLVAPVAAEPPRASSKKRLVAWKAPEVESAPPAPAKRRLSLVPPALNPPGLLDGYGAKRDCALYEQCLDLFVQTHPHAIQARCRPACEMFVAISRDVELARASTSKRGRFE